VSPSVLKGPLRPATGPHDYEGLGRERYWDLTPEQRAEALPKVVSDANLEVLRSPDKEFARGWLSEQSRHQRGF
jgi:hypothetical protein